MTRLTAGMAAFVAAGALASFNSVRADEPNKSEDSKYFEKIVQLYAADAPDAKKPAEKGDSGWITLVVKDGEDAGKGDVWIGARVNMPDDELRKKLDLPKDEGVVVQQVIPDSPAAKAELKVGDVLLSAGDKPLKELSDALDAVRKAKDGKVTFMLLRDGKKIQTTLKPVKRPAEFGIEGPVPVQPGKEAGEKERRAIVRIFEKSAGGSDLAKIRAELRAVREQINNIDRQLAELETGRSSADRERLDKQMAALKRAINDLNDAGRTDDAERLKRELREMAEKLQGGGEKGAGVPLRGALNLTYPAALPPGGMATGGLGVTTAKVPQNMFYVADSDGSLRVTLTPPDGTAPAATMLKLPPPVNKAGAESSAANLAELRKEVEQLRRELYELREQAAKKEKR